MDVFQFAIQREIESEAYYRNLSVKCRDNGLKRILERFADAEVRHADVVRKMQQKTLEKLPEDAFLADMKSMFCTVRDRGEFDFSMEQVDVYAKAQSFEKETMELYQKAAADAEDDLTREVLTKMAIQEKRHYQILGTIIEMIEKASEGGWLENAEWFHIEEY